MQLCLRNYFYLFWNVQNVHVCCTLKKQQQQSTIYRPRLFNLTYSPLSSWKITNEIPFLPNSRAPNPNQPACLHYELYVSSHSSGAGGVSPCTGREPVCWNHRRTIWDHPPQRWPLADRQLSVRQQVNFFRWLQVLLKYWCAHRGHEQGEYF